MAGASLKLKSIPIAFKVDTYCFSSRFLLGKEIYVVLYTPISDQWGQTVPIKMSISAIQNQVDFLQLYGFVFMKVIVIIAHTIW